MSEAIQSKATKRWVKGVEAVKTLKTFKSLPFGAVRDGLLAKWIGREGYEIAMELDHDDRWDGSLYITVPSDSIVEDMILELSCKLKPDEFGWVPSKEKSVCDGYYHKRGSMNTLRLWWD